MSKIDYILCYKIYKPYLKKFVCNRLKEELVEDIIQDVFVILWEKHNDIEKSKAKTFLFNTAQNIILQKYRYLKKLNNTKKIENIDIGCSCDQDNFETMNYVKLIIEEVPDAGKKCLLMYALQGYSYAEIAVKLNISEAIVKHNIFNARTKLKKLSKYDF